IGVRGPVYFAAGAARVPYLRFLMWDAFAATIVVSVIFSLGYFFGPAIGELIHKAETFLTISALIVVVFAGAIWLVHRRMKAALEHLADEIEDEVAATEGGSATAESVNHKSVAGEAIANGSADPAEPPAERNTLPAEVTPADDRPAAARPAEN
ncbi:MAG: hypothetical protein AAF596_05445, partial [Planctomycetota bacterium]